MRISDWSSDVCSSDLIALLEKTRDGYRRAETIAENRYKVGVAARSDMLSAQSQLYSTRADLEGLQRTRAQLEHAIAVLLGKAPAEFALTAADWNGAVPQVRSEERRVGERVCKYV